MKIESENRNERSALIYENILVPSLFGYWGDRILRLVQPGRNRKILDIACGTGILARKFSENSNGMNEIVGIDCNAERLKLARKISPDIRWVHGFAENLPLENESFDIVTCQFGLMFFDEPVRSISEMKRVSSKEGEIYLAVWDRVERNAVFHELDKIYVQRFGEGIVPVLRQPYKFGDIKKLIEVLDCAKIKNYQITTETVAVRYENIEDMIIGDMIGWMGALNIVLTDQIRDSVINEGKKKLANYVSETGLEFSTSAHLVSITKEHRA